MSDSPLGFFERLRARKTDIELPNDTGQVDPRLKQAQKKKGAIEGFSKAAEGLKALRDRGVFKKQE